MLSSVVYKWYFCRLVSCWHQGCHFTFHVSTLFSCTQALWPVGELVFLSWHLPHLQVILKISRYNTKHTYACRMFLILNEYLFILGIMGEMIYAPYDLTGIKFLWWTWHDTDAPVNQRLLGVPIGSTVWVITFTATFQFFVSLTIKNETNWIKQVVGLIVTSCFSTPVMMIQMAILQLVSLDIQALKV